MKTVNKTHGSWIVLGVCFIYRNWNQIQTSLVLRKSVDTDASQSATGAGTSEPLYPPCYHPDAATLLQQGVYKSSLTNFQEISRRFPGHI